MPLSCVSPRLACPASRLASLGAGLRRGRVLRHQGKARGPCALLLALDPARPPPPAAAVGWYNSCAPPPPAAPPPSRRPRAMATGRALRHVSCG